MGPQFFVDGGFVCTYKGITRLLGKGSVRITPAHAGKSTLLVAQSLFYEDHPRTRGEKQTVSVLVFLLPGSPPHTRGKALMWRAWSLMGRITPAHAGKSTSTAAPEIPARDHPRTRGEKPCWFRVAFVLIGSPPHTRGKGKLQIPEFPLYGITPAHAGKRAKSQRIPRHIEDHPRTRGEKR